MKRGDLVTVTATIDAFRGGLNSGRQIRVNVNGTLVWVPIGMTDFEERERKEDVLEYVREERRKRLIGLDGLGNRSIDDDLDTMIKWDRKEG